MLCQRSELIKVECCLEKLTKYMKIKLIKVKCYQAKKNKKTTKYIKYELIKSQASRTTMGNICKTSACIVW